MCERCLWDNVLRTKKSVCISKLDIQLLLWFAFFFSHAALFKSVILLGFIMTNFINPMTATDSLGVEKHTCTRS